VPRWKSPGTTQLRADAAHRATVVVVGSINIDLVVRVPRLPVPAETVTGGAFERHQGGKGANQAVAAARLGATVALVGAVGDDEFGREALVDLGREGIDVGRVIQLSDSPTGVAVVVVDESGENQIAVASGANTALSAEQVESALAGPQMPPVGVLLVSFELSDAAVLAAARVGAERGMHVVVNPAPARELPQELLRTAPILVANESETEALTGEREPSNGARALAARTAAPVVVTLGAAGAILVVRDDVEHLPAPIVEVVDTIGAGDTFCGALCAELAAGAALSDAARVAVRAASLSVTSPGARGGMPTRKDLDRA
jgi:ribokinase